MAELGNIDVRDLESGAVRPSEGREVIRGFGNVLDAVGAAHLADVLGDAKAEAEGIVDEARLGATTTREPEENLASSLSGEAGEIQRQAKRYMDVIRRGETSQVDLAKLHLQRLYNQLGSQHSSLRRQIAAEIDFVAQSDPDLQELALIDQINAANAKQAQADRQSLVDFAQAPWPTGLGIPTHIPPESAEFANMYVENVAGWQRMQAYNREMDLILAEANVSVQAKSDIIVRNLNDFGNQAQQHLDIFWESPGGAKDYYAELAKVAAGQPANVAFMQTFESEIKPQMISQIDNLIAASQTVIREATKSVPNAPSVPAYQRLQTYQDDFIEELQSLKNAIETGDKTGIETARASYELRAMDMLNKDPAFTATKMRFEAAQPLFDAINKLDMSTSALNIGQDFINDSFSLDAWENFMRGVSPAQRTSVAGAEGIVTGGGMANGAEGLTADEIRTNTVASWSNRRNGVFGNRSSSKEETTVNGLAWVQQLAKSGKVSGLDENPMGVRFFMDAAIGAVEAMKVHGTKDPEAVQFMEQYLAEDSLITTLGVGANDVNKEHRLAFAGAVRDYVESRKPANRNREYALELEQAGVNGQPYSYFVDFVPDTGELESTSMYTFKVDKNKVRQSLQSAANLEPTSVTRVSEDRVNATSAKISRHVSNVLSKINRSVRTEAMLELAEMDYYDPKQLDYLVAYDANGWLDYFNSE